jgi:hypothetical protein
MVILPGLNFSGLVGSQMATDQSSKNRQKIWYEIVLLFVAANLTSGTFQMQPLQISATFSSQQSASTVNSQSQ